MKKKEGMLFFFLQNREQRLTFIKREKTMREEIDMQRKRIETLEVFVDEIRRKEATNALIVEQGENMPVTESQAMPTTSSMCPINDIAVDDIE